MISYDNGFIKFSMFPGPDTTRIRIQDLREGEVWCALGPAEIDELILSLRMCQRHQTGKLSDEEMRNALQTILDGYGPNHGSKFCRDVAARALKGDPE
jgi:hypothetical protein